MSHPSRRDLLRSGLAGLSLMGCPRPNDKGDPLAPSRSPDPSSPWPGTANADSTRFPAGVMAGDPNAEGLLLWTRYLGSKAVSVTVVVWAGGAWQDHSSVEVQPDDAGFVHHWLDGLPADQPVAFQFNDASGAASAVGNGRTAPTLSGPLRLLATSCSKYRTDGFPSLTYALARGPIDLAIWCGDTVYTYDQTLEEYRARWTRNYQIPDLAAAFAATTHVFTWDDHEVANNWNPEDADPEQLASGTQAFFDFTPTRSDKPGRIWRKIGYGPLLDVFVLDCRGERAPSQGRYISDAQASWLIDEVAASSAVWKIIVNSVPITNMPAPFEAVAEVLADRWEGYPEQRESVLAGLDGVEGVLWLTGDFHLPAIAHLEPNADDARYPVWEILTGPLGSEPNPLAALMYNNPDIYRAQFPWSVAERTATLIEVHSDRVLVEFIGNDDQSWVVAAIGLDGTELSMAITEPS